MRLGMEEKRTSCRWHCACRRRDRVHPVHGPHDPCPDHDHGPHRRLFAGGTDARREGKGRMRMRGQLVRVQRERGPTKRKRCGGAITLLTALPGLGLLSLSVLGLAGSRALSAALVVPAATGCGAAASTLGSAGGRSRGRSGVLCGSRGSGTRRGVVCRRVCAMRVRDGRDAVVEHGQYGEARKETRRQSARGERERWVRY